MLGDQWNSLQLPLDASLVSAAPYELVRIHLQTCKISDVLWLEISGLHLQFSLDASRSAVPSPLHWAFSLDASTVPTNTHRYALSYYAVT